MKQIKTSAAYPDGFLLEEYAFMSYSPCRVNQFNDAPGSIEMQIPTSDGMINYALNNDTALVASTIVNAKPLSFRQFSENVETMSVEEYEERNGTELDLPSDCMVWLYPSNLWIAETKDNSFLLNIENYSYTSKRIHSLEILLYQYYTIGLVSERSARWVSQKEAHLMHRLYELCYESVEVSIHWTSNVDDDFFQRFGDMNDMAWPVTDSFDDYSLMMVRFMERVLDNWNKPLM